jgi:hypothetical protein
LVFQVDFWAVSKIGGDIYLSIKAGAKKGIEVQRSSGDIIMVAKKPG